MTQMLAQREHDYFAETVICANCYIVALIISFSSPLCGDKGPSFRFFCPFSSSVCDNYIILYAKICKVYNHDT